MPQLVLLEEAVVETDLQIRAGRLAVPEVRNVPAVPGVRCMPAVLVGAGMSRLWQKVSMASRASSPTGTSCNHAAEPIVSQPSGDATSTRTA